MSSALQRLKLLVVRLDRLWLLGVMVVAMATTATAAVTGAVAGDRNM